MDSPAPLLLLAAILLIAIVGVIVLLFSTKNSPKLNVAKYQTKWLAIENSISRDNAASLQLGILQADKLLDQALRERRFKGQTMGERMKSANHAVSYTHLGALKFSKILLAAVLGAPNAR